ncbi:MAG: tRNA (adenosine(37)-N6)-threonylcarbamoyltransferase complex dimerization subunit type 1 TsaB [Roseivirga sp.]|nr:tRNA (adenosine(37)-N6)-threonylcarbamoyltransferase complex dimerization subunit type 1 TsaB [Roseivirga sp.]
MSLILSIETSTNVCSVALTKDGSTLATQKLYLEKSHSTLLTVVIQSLLDHTEVHKEDLSAIAVSKGPGSYTGLRIGVSTAKGLCYALDKPLVAVNTLKAMAQELSQYNSKGMLLCPMLDARRMEVYTALFDADLNEIEPTKALILDESSFLETLAENNVLFFGNGSDKLKSLVGENANAHFVENITPSASAVGVLAARALGEGRAVDVAYFEPFYLKDFRATKPKKLL